MSQLVAGVPAIVKYKHFDEEHLAFPVDARDLKDHTGANNEPLLSLVIVKPVIDPSDHNPDPKLRKVLNVIGTSNELQVVQIVHDVPHETFENKNFPGGRWVELDNLTVSQARALGLVASSEDEPQPEPTPMQVQTPAADATSGVVGADPAKDGGTVQ